MDSSVSSPWHASQKPEAPRTHGIRKTSLDGSFVPACVRGRSRRRPRSSSGCCFAPAAAAGQATARTREHCRAPPTASRTSAASGRCATPPPPICWITPPGSTCRPATPSSRTTRFPISRGRRRRGPKTFGTARPPIRWRSASCRACRGSCISISRSRSSRRRR